MKYNIIRSSYISVLIMMLIAMVLLQGCDQSDDAVTSNQPATIKGRVEGDNGSPSFAKTTAAGIEGAIVTVAQVQANGSLQVVSNSEAETNSTGEFTVQTNLSGASNLIVSATRNGETWRAVVSSTVQAGGTVYSRPLDIESTVEAEVYINVVSQGHADSVSSSDISLYVSAELAAEVYGDDNSIEALTDAIVVSVETRFSALASVGTGATQAQIQAMVNAQVTAQKELEGNLHLAGSSNTAIEFAYENYEQAMISVYSQTSVSAETYAKALEVSWTALVKATASLDAEATFEVEKTVAVLRAKTIDIVAQAEFSALTNNQSTLSVVSNAGATLEASLESATDGAQIAAAFESYHNSIVNQLSAVLSTHSSAIMSLDATINSNDGVRSDLRASISASSTTEGLIDTYMNFIGTVNSSVSASLNSATTVQASTTANLLVMLNMIV